MIPFPVLQFHCNTLMVFDDHKNGIPAAWVITSSAAQRDVAIWLADFRRHMRVVEPTFQPSSFLVDDSRAEINAIRLADISLVKYWIS
jgi:hypothetical protein